MGDDNDKITKERVKEALITITEEIIESLPIDWENIPSIEKVNEYTLDCGYNAKILGDLDKNEQILWVLEEHIDLRLFRKRGDHIAGSEEARQQERRKDAASLLDVLLCHHAKIRLCIYDAEVRSAQKYCGRANYRIREGRYFTLHEW